MGFMIQQHALALALALIFDFFLGDLEKFPHPVRWMGKAYIYSERFFKKQGSLTVGAGVATVAFISLFFELIPFFILWFIPFGMARVLVEGFLLYWCLSVRNLSDEAIRVSK